MNFKKFISGVSAFAIAASAFAGMAVTANAYSLRLSMDTTVAGYKAKTLYNFTDNSSGIMPTSGDLRYRDAGYGLYNYGSGNRGADVTMTVSKDDIILIDFNDTQGRSVTVNSVTNGTVNSTLSASTGYVVFDISADATKVNFNVGRAGCIMGVLVMEKDNSVTTADYTIRYKNGEDIVKTDSGTVAVGANIPVSTVFFADNVKYLLAEGEPTSLEVVDGANELEVAVNEAPTYSYSVASNVGDFSVEASTYAGESVTVPYPEYIVVAGTAYYKAPVNNQFNHIFTVNSDNQNETLEYSASKENVVYNAEGENVFSEVNVANANVRCSMGKGGDVSDETAVTVTTLPAGQYKITAAVWGGGKNDSNNSTYLFKAGENEVYSISTTGSRVESTSDTFTLTEDTEITVIKSVKGTSGACIDLVLIQDVTPTETKAFTFDGIKADGVDGKFLTIKVGDSNWTEPVALPTSTKFTGEGTVGIAIIISGIPADTAVSARID